MNSNTKSNRSNKIGLKIRWVHLSSSNVTLSKKKNDKTKENVIQNWEKEATRGELGPHSLLACGRLKANIAAVVAVQRLVLPRLFGGTRTTLEMISQGPPDSLVGPRRRSLSDCSAVYGRHSTLSVHDRHALSMSSRKSPACILYFSNFTLAFSIFALPCMVHLSRNYAKNVGWVHIRSCVG